MNIWRSRKLIFGCLFFQHSPIRANGCFIYDSFEWVQQKHMEFLWCNLSFCLLVSVVLFSVVILLCLKAACESGVCTVLSCISREPSPTIRVCPMLFWWSSCPAVFCLLASKWFTKRAHSRAQYRCSVASVPCDCFHGASLRACLGWQLQTAEHYYYDSEKLLLRIFCTAQSVLVSGILAQLGNPVYS